MCRRVGDRREEEEHDRGNRHPTQPQLIDEWIGDLYGDRGEAEHPGHRCGNGARWAAAQRDVVRPRPWVHRQRRRSRTTTRAAVRPDAPNTPPPGWVEAPVR